MADVAAPPISRKMHDMTDQVVLLTGIGCVGSGWGNGVAIATLFARQGAILFGCDINLSAAKTTRSQILAESPKTYITVMESDCTSSTSMKAFVDACMKKHGRIDVLINNVGRSEPGDPASLSEEVWDAQMDVNLKSVYLTTHIVLPIMAAQPTGGNVVNISSVSGLRYIGKPQVAYSTTKAAILSFTRTTAVIYADKGVRLNTVVPGLINTPLVKMLADKYAGGDYEGYCKVRDAQVPTGKMGSAWDVANAVLFLASKEAGYITGTEIVVDGGLTQSTGRA
ncbi:probable dehydrogenases with different specificities (related to short-chain alcohol dehydrogenases) [Rhynchosporium agropyri]|uniref:Probable dehydrogenases with different specificities (Related to short-chain alcohol dehydrogenases) n=1 Tax=Rhynchosporium agropyri TaxID=914238 RepID=A0A1E1LI41_9HELO|nr:probable dehydrogenases with different specificities (related to short-chain alcohol dehydrogenases) [Rhynchosporium agropyri]